MFPQSTISIIQVEVEGHYFSVLDWPPSWVCTTLSTVLAVLWHDLFTADETYLQIQTFLHGNSQL